MDFKDLEKRFQNDWHDAEESVDVDQLINNIHPLDNGTKKGAYFWSLLGLCVLSALGFGMYSVWNVEQVSVEETRAVAASSIVTKAEKNTEALPIEKVDIEGVVTNETKTPKSNPKTSQKTFANFAKSNQGTNTIKSTTNQSNTVHIIENNVGHQLSSTQEFSTSENKEGVKMELTPKAPSYVEESKQDPTALNLAKFDFLDASKLTLHSSLPQLLKPVECPGFNTPKWTVALGVEGGVFNPFKKLELLNDDQGELYQIRDDNENSLEGLQASVYAQLINLRNPFYFKVGATYSRVTERLELKTTRIEQDTTIGILSITQSQSGDTLTVIYGNIISDVTIETESRAHHYFDLIDIPLGIGYDFELSDKMYLGVEAGLNINVMAQANGKILMDTLNTGDVKNLNSFQRSVGLNYYGSMNLGYNLSDNHSLYLNAKFNINPNDYGSQSNTISQKYNFGGLNVGYRYKF